MKNIRYDEEALYKSTSDIFTFSVRILSFIRDNSIQQIKKMFAVFDAKQMHRTRKQNMNLGTAKLLMILMNLAVSSLSAF